MAKLTEEQIARAKAIDLPLFLQSRGEKLVRAGHEYRWVYTDAYGEHDSITVRGGEWFDHKCQVGGDAIGFLREYMGMGFHEAVVTLLGQRVDAPPLRQTHKPLEAERPPFSLPPKASRMHRLYAYLCKTRHLPHEVVTHFVRAGTLYEDSERHNAVFVATDLHGKAVGAMKKSTLTGSSFRQTVEGSDTRYAFHHDGASATLHVFEAPVDMLSYIAMHQREWTEDSYLALDGLSSKALHQYLADHPHIQAVTLCLDHDAAGIEASLRIRDELPGYEMTRLLPQRKDWNEDIRDRLGLPSQPAVEHPKLAAYGEAVEALQRLDLSVYVGYLRLIGADNALSAIRRGLSRLSDPPEGWYPTLMRTAALCATVASRDTSETRKTLRSLELRYRPHLDRGRWRAHSEDVRRCALALDASPERLMALADACLKAAVYLETDFKMDMSQDRAPPLMDVSM